MPATPLHRSRSQRWIAGVCGGLAERWGWSPGKVRMLFVVVTVIPGLPGLPIYLLLWLLVPIEARTRRGPENGAWTAGVEGSRR